MSLFLLLLFFPVNRKQRPLSVIPELLTIAVLNAMKLYYQQLYNTNHNRPTAHFL